MLPVKQTEVPVELDQFYNMFDAPTRRAAQRNLEGFGNAFAGRGYDLNRTITDAPRLFKGLRNVMSNLADPRTRLDNFFKELGDAARIVAPISQTNAQVFTELADTFEAISRDEQALKDTITENVPTLQVGTESLRVSGRSSPRPPTSRTTCASRPRTSRRRCPTSTARSRSAPPSRAARCR